MSQSIENNYKKIVTRAVVVLVLCVFLAILLSRFFVVFCGLIFLICCCVGLIIITMAREMYRRANEPQSIYKKKTTIVTPSEQNFYQILLRAVPQYNVFQQVPLSSVVDKVAHGAFRNELFRVVDYCIVDPKTHQPLLLIELNDASHKRADRVLRDQKVKEICDIAKLNLIAFDSSQTHTEKEVARIIKREIKKKF